MQHDAIIALNSSIVRVVTKKATGQTIAYDDKGNEVSWDADAVATKEARRNTPRCPAPNYQKTTPRY